MRGAGIIVGDVGPNYFPQVYDVDMIARKKDGFISAMGKYFSARATLRAARLQKTKQKPLHLRVFKN